MLHITLSGELLFTIGSFPVTSTMLTTWLVMVILIISSFIINHSYSKNPDKITKTRVAIEAVIGGIYSIFESILGASTPKLFPLLGTFFIFIIASNWIGLLPGVGSVGIVESEPSSSENSQSSTGLVSQIYASETTDESASTENDTTNEGEETIEKIVPIFRAPTSDLNTTLALALISVIALQWYGFKALGGAYFKKYISFSNPIIFFVGILEIIGELGKIISFAFRLFGNIFAGEVLLAVIAFLIPLFAPIPFLGLEIFVGFIQALVFTMLLSVFLNVATQHAEH